MFSGQIFCRRARAWISCKQRKYTSLDNGDMLSTDERRWMQMEADKASYLFVIASEAQ
jgi:hypothetical protein